MFERLHRNHKWAFIDGFLTGTLTTAFVAHLLKQKLEQSHRDKLYSTEMKWHDRGFMGGWDDALRCARSIPEDSEFYPKPFPKKY